MFFRNRLCRWTVRVLLAWLFGIAAGAANACLVERGAHGETAHAGALAVVHLDAEARLDCLDFCEAAAAVVPASKATSDAVGAAIAPADNAAHAPPADVRCLPIASARPAQRGAVPIPISFLRLAL